MLDIVLSWSVRW